jgi:methionyl-tRNA synthetase
MSNILITTAISYTNGSPHVGHLYESVLADFITKSFGLFHHAKLLTGTDEHGKKIQSTAQALGLEPIELCNTNSEKFVQLNKNLQVDFSHWIRTTDPTHKALVSDSIGQSAKSGDIYLDNYSGYYNVREECFISEMEAKETNYADPVTGKPYEKVTEESYFFRLEKYKSNIIQLLNSGLVFPPGKFTIGDRLENLKDLSISRTSFNWGIPFPQLDSEKPHVVYVWFDALLNYVTGAKILGDNFDQTIHIIGKDILWFHAVIYPGILESCGYSNKYQAKNILVHGFITDANGMKMSKSVGNVIEPSELFAQYPLEAIRYYLLMETIWGEDIKFNQTRLKDMYNNQLIKDFGNLFQRLFTLAKPIGAELNKYFSDNVELIGNNFNEFLIVMKSHVEKYDLVQYKELITSKCAHANKELTVKKPWEKSVETNIKIELIAQLLVELKCLMILHYPIIPEKITQLAGYLGWAINTKPNFNLSICPDKIRAFDAISI